MTPRVALLIASGVLNLALLFLVAWLFDRLDVARGRAPRQ